MRLTLCNICGIISDNQEYVTSNMGLKKWPFYTCPIHEGITESINMMGFKMKEYMKETLEAYR